ncbi:unnamed protein product [Ranitomeya imitator]|uniref:Uncharacterized protein n=1 Tax=Ranitomeya imitator TaxID=111125 RepID=A0ABN9KXF0_9NEOB|nr:unnamed protein product [Ranitomeya imitator]
MEEDITERDCTQLSFILTSQRDLDSNEMGNTEEEEEQVEKSCKMVLYQKAIVENMLNKFPLDNAIDTRSVDHEILQVADYLDKERFSGNGRVLRDWIESMLSQVTFDEETHHFGKGPLQAVVYKLHSANVLLETVVPGTRLQVVRMLAASALFQDAANSTVMGNRVVGVTLEGIQVSNLTEDIVVTFHHQPLQVTAVLGAKL